MVKWLVLILILFTDPTGHPSHAQDLQNLSDQLCFGQCPLTEESFSISARDRRRHSLQLNFQDGFYSITGSNGVTQRFPYQNSSEALSAAMAIADQFSGALIGGGDVYSQISEYFQLVAFDGPVTAINLRQQQALRLRQKTYCEGTPIASELQAFCQQLLSTFSATAEIQRQQQELLEQRQSGCVGNPLNATSMRRIFQIVQGAMAAESMDMNDSYCNASTGTLGVALNQLGLVQGEDYQFTRGENHVFATVPNSDAIIDPTYLQFINRDCPIFQQLQATPGFFGTRSELKQFFITNRTCFRPLTSQAATALSRQTDNEAWWQEVERLYYGRDSSFTGLTSLAQNSLQFQQNMISQGTHYPGSGVQTLLSGLGNYLENCNGEANAREVLMCQHIPENRTSLRLANDMLEVSHEILAPPAN